MIFYFSGTGNSLWVAKRLSERYNEMLMPIAGELMKPIDSQCYEVRTDEKIFFVYPVHSWGLPVLVYRFLESFALKNYTNQSVYAVCTCGDECGYTDSIMRRQLRKKSISLTGIYSIKMPNNYILMKGFGVDPKEIEKVKLDEAPLQLEKIMDLIDSGEYDNNLYITGNFPWLKSRIIYPFFSKYAIGRNSFYATVNCTKCGLCARICPTKTIKIKKDSYPSWDNTCIQCTACIHRCPVRAIEYGKVTQDQGRYCHPDLR